jgi:hypothetical protein
LWVSDPRAGNIFRIDLDGKAGPDGFASARVLLATPDGKVCRRQYGAPERIDGHECA